MECGVITSHNMPRLFFGLLPGSRIHHDDTRVDPEAHYRRPAHPEAHWEAGGGGRLGPTVPGICEDGAVCHALRSMPVESGVGLSFVQLRFSIVQLDTALDRSMAMHRLALQLSTPTGRPWVGKTSV